MRPDYTPLTTPTEHKTTRGLIKYEQGGPNYYTHRQHNHFFIKYRGFGISTSEIEAIHKHHVQYIIIIYHNKPKENHRPTQTPYRIHRDKLPMINTYYDNDGDKQLIIPLHQLQTKTYKNINWHYKN